MELLWQRLEGRSGHEVGRQLLRQLWGGQLPQIAVTPKGRPYFPDEPFFFSISHSKNHAFCVLSRRPVGIDAEEADRDIDLRLAEKILSPAEKGRYLAAPDRRAALLRLWVLKESWAKLTGKGWGPYLYRTDFSPDDPRITEIDGCFVAILEDEHYAL